MGITGVSASVHFGEEPESEKADAERRADLAHLRQMLVGLAAGLMQRLQRAARQLELAAGLQADVATEGVALRPLQGDDVVAFQDRFPAEPLDHFLQQRLDAARSLIGQGGERIGVKAELFMLGADAPFFLRLGAFGDPVHEIGLALDRRAGVALLTSGHAVSLRIRSSAAGRRLAPRPPREAMGRGGCWATRARICRLL